MRTDTVTHRAMLQAIDKGYHITEDGIVKKGRHKVVPLQKHHTQGYLHFGMWVNLDGKKRSRLIPVHQFQAFEKYGAEAFEHAQCVRHLDGDRSNNHIDNIALGTLKQNYKDRSAENRRAAAVKGWQTKQRLKEDDWQQAINMRREGKSYNEIAKALNLEYMQVANGLRYRKAKG